MRQTLLGRWLLRFAWFVSCAVVSSPGSTGNPTTWAAADGPSIVVQRPDLTHGWTLHLNRRLLDVNPDQAGRAVELLGAQLQGIAQTLPPEVVTELRRVPLFFSPPYPQTAPTAEYHPSAEWLRQHQRDPRMAQGVEFTNIATFEAETERMPNFVLHELAHAYHDRVLPQGYENPQVQTAYDQAKRSGGYERVERYHGGGRPTTREPAYALANPMEYFAETTEAYFGRNDFFPFTRAQLQQHDPRMHALLEQLWRVK